jgi:hypothetical protein
MAKTLLKIFIKSNVHDLGACVFRKNNRQKKNLPRPTQFPRLHSDFGFALLGINKQTKNRENKNLNYNFRLSTSSYIAFTMPKELNSTSEA